MSSSSLNITVIGRCRPKFYQQDPQHTGLAYSHRPTRHLRHSSLVASIVAAVKLAVTPLDRMTFHRT